MNSSTDNSLYRKSILTLAYFITLLGAFSLSFWFFHFDFLLQHPPVEWPIPFTSTWCIFFSGIGFLAILLKSRFFLKEIFAAPILLISSLRLMELILEREFGLQWFFLKLLNYSPEPFPLMAFFSAVGFILISLILIAWPRYLSLTTKSTLLITLSSVLLLLGCIGTLSYLLPTPIIFGWHDLIPINILTAVTQILLGTGFLIHRFYIDIYKKTNAIIWISSFIPSLILIFLILINFGLSAGKNASIIEVLKSKAETAEYVYTTIIKNNIYLINKFSHLIANPNETSPNWKSEAASLIKNTNEINRIYWTDKNFIIQENLTDETIVGLPTDISSDLRRQFTQNSSQESVFIDLDPVRGNLLLCSPIIQNGQFQGACIAELKVTQIFKTIAELINHNYIFTVFYRDTELFSYKSSIEKIPSLQVSRPVTIANFSLTFEIFPTKNLLEYRLNNFYRLLILIGGILLSLSLGYLIFCWHSWQTIAQTAQRILRFSEDLLIPLNTAENQNSACQKLLNLLNQLHPWNMLVLWKWNASTQSLDCSEILYSSLNTFPNFEHFIRKPFALDTKNLAARVFIDRKPISIIDLGQETNYPCSASAAADGIKGTIAFPIFEKEKATGVICILKNEFFLQNLEPEILDLLPTIGIEFGQFLQRKNFEQKQKEFSDIIQFSLDALFSIDLNGTIKTWNPGAEIIYGWTAHEAIGRNIYELTIPPSAKEELIQRKKALREGTQILNLETQRLKKNGSLIWLSISYAPIRDEMGTLIGAAITARDITLQKTTGLLLAASEEKMRIFIESTDDWIWEVNTAAQYTFSNPSVQSILGFTPAEIMGMDFFSLVPEEEEKKLREELDRYIQLKCGWRHRMFPLKKKNGTICWIESTGMPFFNEHDEIMGFRGTTRDISEQKNLERTKNEFISMISHELRTPLTSIVGALGLLGADHDLSAKDQELLTLANRNSKRLTRIINDILDIEKLQLGKLQLQLQTFDLLNAVREGIDIAKPLAEKMNIKIIEGPVIDKIQVNADYDRIIQVMLNLLSNAIKFSPPQAKITVWMERIGEKVRVSIRDEGKGISPEFQSEIFEKFKQGDQTDARIVGGTGLGLNICKQLLNIMGGSIHFTSQQFVGTVFYFELPIQAS